MNTMRPAERERAQERPGRLEDPLLPDGVVDQRRSPRTGGRAASPGTARARPVPSECDRLVKPVPCIAARSRRGVIFRRFSQEDRPEIVRRVRLEARARPSKAAIPFCVRELHQLRLEPRLADPRLAADQEAHLVPLEHGVQRRSMIADLLLAADELLAADGLACRLPPRVCSPRSL